MLLGEVGDRSSLPVDLTTRQIQRVIATVPESKVDAARADARAPRYTG